MLNGKKADIGLIGLGVMGRNLALNIESKGWNVAVYNRTVPQAEEKVVENFINGDAKGKNIEGFTDLSAFAQDIETPRKIMFMVKAGEAVDQLMEQLFPLLSPGDILIDGGNSYFEDTNRRVALAESKGFLFVGCGVSGGEEGALNGPSLMPGGSAAAWPIIKPIFQSIAAKTVENEPCCEWIGPDGSGHFVKMVHNGIEYGDMEIIAEAYWMMKKLIDLDNDQMAEVFQYWNQGKLRSYLIEITSNILQFKEKDGEYLIDNILDVAGQKGTGSWSVTSAMELGMPLGMIASAVFERCISAEKTLRQHAAKAFVNDKAMPVFNKRELVGELFSALYASKLVSYAQGFEVMRAASKTYNWNLNLSEIANVWREGCIIRSIFLNEIANAYKGSATPEHMLMIPYFRDEIKSLIPGWKDTIVKAIQNDIPVPAFSAALNYFNSLKSGKLPANLIQAQRDYFGAHTFERTDDLRGKFFHAQWANNEGNTHFGSYGI